MTSQDFEKSLVALACWQEHDAGLDAMLGVAHVLRNRVAIWSEPYAHLAMQVFHSADEQALPDTRDPLFTRLLQSLDRVDGAKDPTDGALYYGNPHQLSDELKEAITGREMVAKIGTFYFWK